MKLVCTQENLSRALSHLERVVGKQTTLPILSNFLLETENGRLKLSATNLEIGVISHIGAKIEREGRITVPAKILSNFIHNLPSGDVLELETEGQTLKVTASTYQMKMKGLDGKDFPIIPQYKKEYFFALPAQELKNALSRILFCVSINEARLELTGAYISFFEGEMYIVATDSFRLAEEKVILSDLGTGYREFLQKNPTLIIPANTLQEIFRVITPESKEVKIALEENQIFFGIDEAQVISRSINGKFPDYKQILPETFSVQGIFQKEDLLRAIKIASTFSSYSSGEVSLSFDTGKNICIVASQSQEIGENQTVLPVQFLQGEGELRMVFNPRYILEGLSALSGEKIVFLANASTTPAALRMMDETQKPDKRYIYLMMPIRK